MPDSTALPRKLTKNKGNTRKVWRAAFPILSSSIVVEGVVLDLGRLSSLDQTKEPLYLCLSYSRIGRQGLRSRIACLILARKTKNQILSGMPRGVLPATILFARGDF